jgi:hypothetical protein
LLYVAINFLRGGPYRLLLGGLRSLRRRDQALQQLSQAGVYAFTDLVKPAISQPFRDWHHEAAD